MRRGKVSRHDAVRKISRLYAAIYSPFSYLPLTSLIQPYPISEMSWPQVEYDPAELEEIEQWEAAALEALEIYERQRDHKRRREEELDPEEMQKRQRVEEHKQQVRQEAAARRVAAARRAVTNARKN